MRKIILVLLLTCAPASWAEVWVEVGKSEKYTAHIDPSTIRKEGDLAKAWDMFDYQAVQPGVGGKRYWSVKHQLEYDCKQEKLRALAVAAHSDHQAKGELVAASSVSDNWKVITKGSTDELLWRYVCTKGK